MEFMNNNRGLIVSIVLVMLMIGFVSGLEAKKTEISFTTEKRLDFTLKIIDSETGDTLQKLKETTDGAGYFMYEYYSLVDSIDFLFEATYNDEDFEQEFNDYFAGEPAVLDINLPKANVEEADLAPVVDESVTLDSVSDDSAVDSKDSQASLTGLAVLDSVSVPKSAYYLLAAFALAGAVTMFMIRRSGKNGMVVQQSVGSQISSPSVVQKSQVEDVAFNSKKVAEKEKRISALREELSKLQEEEKIDELEEKVKEEIEELRKLKGRQKGK